MQCVCLTSKHVKYHLQHCNASYLETYLLSVWYVVGCEAAMTKLLSYFVT